MTTINGTPGNDVLSTSTAGDTINAAAGNDQVTLVLNASADGGDGDDLVVMDLHAVIGDQSFTFADGGTSPYPVFYYSNTYLNNFESIHLITGSGNDTGTFTPSLTTSVWGPDTWDAGSGNDTLVVHLQASSSDTTAGYVNASTYQVTQADTSSPILITAYNVENVDIIGTYNPNTDTFSGGAGDDQLISYALHSYLNGGDGNDLLHGHGGTLDGGAGFDIASADLEPDYLTGNGETVTFNNDGTLTLTDSYSTTLLKNIEQINMYDISVRLGTVGDDTVALNYYAGMYMAGPGNDTITVAAGMGSHIIDGGDGNDTVLFSDIANYGLGTNYKGDVTVTAKADYPPAITTLVNIETVKFNGVVAILGTGGDDSLTGTAADNVLFGGPGNDTLDGGGGNDIAAFSGNYNDNAITINQDGSATVVGPDGTDTLRNIEKATFADATVTLGTAGNDSVVLNGYSDGSPIPGYFGGPGDDTVTVNGGPTFFDGGPGIDTVILPMNYQDYMAGMAYNPSSGNPNQFYATQINLTRLMNVEIVQFNNGTATLSNGQLTFTAAQPVLNNTYGSVFINDTTTATTLDRNITLNNIGGSPITSAVIKIATGFVAGDVLSADLTGTGISASYDSATGTLTLSGADTTAHYQQVLRSVQMKANVTLISSPGAGSVTWQVTNSDARTNVSALVTTSLFLPSSRVNSQQYSEIGFISGVGANGNIASQSFQTWTGDDFFAQYDPHTSLAAKWGANTAGTTGGTISYYFDPASAWTATEQSVISAGLALWSAEANINFAVTTDSAGAGITFVRGSDGDADTTPHAAGDANAGTIYGTDLSQLTSAVISIDTSVPGFGPIGDFGAYGGYAVGTVLHEEGHALGLGHAGPYDGTVYAQVQQLGAYDSQLWSLMSYISPQDTHAKMYNVYDVKGTNWGTTTESTGTYNDSPTTPMALDIAAAQFLYGAPVNSPLSGGQVFGFNTNIAGAIRPFFDFTQNTKPVVTLFDTGANNTLDLSGFSTNAAVNLGPGTFSSAGGMTNNISIDLFTKIDRFIGGAGNDVITANNDGDVLFGGPGSDKFFGGTGSDTLDGGPGFDIATYARNSTAYTITRNVNGSVTVYGPDGTDTLTNIEKLAFTDKSIVIGNVAAADFNGAGHSDLVWQGISGQPVVWLMNGSAVLGQAAIGSNPGPSWHVKSTGDFDGDGNADILWQNDSGQAFVWLMNGFSVVGSAAVGSNPGSNWHVIGAGDFDSDGKSDILWQNDSGQVAVWLMNGSNVASSAAIANNPGSSWHVRAVGDVSGDGKSDIVFQSDSGQLAIWLMNGTTVSSGAAIANNPGSSWHVVGSGDFDGDFKSDILFQNDSGQLAIWLMNGTTVSGGAAIAGNPGSTWHVKGTADLDGDGKADILWQSTSGQAMAWFMNGTTVASTSLLGSNPGPNWQIVNDGLVSARKTANDFNGDHYADLLFQNDSGQTALWFMNGLTLGSGAAIANNSGPSWHVRGTGDFDGDGKADILFQNDSGQVALWLMNGSTIAGGAALANNPGPSWHVIGTGDFDGDGKSDLLWQNDSGQAAVWLMNGASVGSGAQVGSNPGPTWHLKGTGDFDGDGKADLLWQNDSGQAAIWFMNGTNVQGGAQVGNNPGPSWHVKGAGDFNGDGKADILWQSDAGQAVIWLMDGQNVLSQAAIGANPGSSWHVTGAADLNGDGVSDILWQNDSGQAAAWLMSGTNVLSAATIGASPGASWHLIAASG